VAVYFASDMHLRLDRPDRSRRLADWVDSLDPQDSLYLGGDVCDFWFASRQVRSEPMSCRGLQSLADFRARGGRLTIIPGNHDLWLGPFYESLLGARFVPEPLTVDAYGLRIRMVHGHRTGGRPPWKSVMESRAFLKWFGKLPAAVANQLDRRLESTNDAHRDRDERGLLPLFRAHAAQVGPEADLIVFGHVHTPLDEPASHTRPRLVVLGGWHTQSSTLKIDEQGARLIVSRDSIPVTI
jgi:UDP-2,3-diacylglucosamine hydrolase